MSAQLEVYKPNNTQVQLHDWTPEQLDLVKRMYCKDATDDELKLFAHVCKVRKLNPFIKQIHAVKRHTKEGPVMTFQTSIDAFRLIAERTKRYCPGREPSFEYDKNGNLFSATAYTLKLRDDGTWHEVANKAFYREFVQEYNGKPSQFWAKMPHLMLAKCAEALCLRKAFPEDLSGLYTDDEMSQAENTIKVTPIQEARVIPSKEIEEPKISAQQAHELEEALSLCDPVFHEKVLKTLAENKITLENLEDIKVTSFKKLMPCVILNSKKYQESQKVEPAKEAPRSMDEVEEAQ